MRLLSVQIENFGVLSGFSYRFDEDLTVFLEENGFGKTTLSDFISVMLFGFDDEKKKSAEKERNRYMPWNHGIYGGKLSFEVNGKAYVLTRQFGKTKSEDFFELRDLNTNLISSDFTDHIGEEIFHLSKDSFLRTIMISESQSMKIIRDGKVLSLNDKNGMPSDINAKIGSIKEEADLGDYKIAEEQFKKLLNNYSPTRQTGKIYQLEEEKRTLNLEILSLSKLEEELRVLEEHLSMLDEKKEETKNNLDKVRKELLIVMEKQKNVEIRLKYLQIEKAYQNKKKEVQKEREAFLYGIPSESKLFEVKEKLTRKTYLKEKILSKAVSKREEENLKEYQTLFENVENPKKSTEKALLSSNQYFTEKEAILSIKKKIEENEKSLENKKPNRQGTIVLLFGVLLFIAGFALIVMKTISHEPFNVGIYVTAGGMILAFLGLFMTKRDKDRIVKEYEEEREKFSLSYSQSKKNINSLKEELESFLSSCQMSFSEETLLKDVSVLHEKALNYERILLEIKESDVENEKKEYDDISRELRSFISMYHLERNEGNEKLEESDAFLLEEITKISMLKNEMEKDTDELQHLLEERMQFLSEHDVSAFSEESENDSLELESFQKKEKEYIEILENIEEEKRIDKSKRERILDSLDLLDEKKEELKNIESDLFRLKKNYKLLEIAGKYLKTAKEDMNMKYSRPVLFSFQKNVKEILNEETVNAYVDANLHLTLELSGKQRDTSVLSKGLQDLYGFLYRISLIDVMYQEEKPFLILDDPFINLDEKKTERMLHFLEKLKEDYQVIYFTCHPSRIM